jgi:hypothetical protein
MFLAYSASLVDLSHYGPYYGSLSHPPGLDVTLEAMVHQFFLHIMAINMDNLI